MHTSIKHGVSFLTAFAFVIATSGIASAAVPYPASDVLGQLTGGSPDFTTFDTNNISAPNSYGLSSANDVVVDSVNNKLFISDGGNNRVLVHDLDGSNNLIDLEADSVLGQSNFTSNTNATTQSGLDDPHALAVDSANSLLFVADQDNNRIMVFDYTTITDGENAVNVLGQADFTSSGSATTQSGMNTPSALAFDPATDYLFVGEDSNSRVLVFDVSAISDGENAINVLGAPDFTTIGGGVNAGEVGDVEGVAVDSSGQRLFVSDNSQRRVVVYDIATITDGDNAVNVLGATDLTTLPGSTASQSSVYTPGDLAYDEANDRLFVANNSFDRIMVFDTTSITDNENAINVIGQPDFTSSGNNSDLAEINPGGLDIVGDELFVVDISYWSRVQIFDVATVSNGENMSGLIGQTDGNGNANHYSFNRNDQHTNSVGFSTPSQMVVDEVKHRLYIADTYNYRIVVHYLSTTNELIDYEADAVIGQSNLTSNVYESSVQSRVQDPTGLALDTKNQYLYVAENANSRVTVFDVDTITNGENAIYVLGAPDFNTYNNDLTAAGLRYPTHVELDVDRNLLFVSDYLENRVLVYDTSSLSNGMNASYVLGQPDFTTNNDGVTTQSSLDRPIASSYDPTSKMLFVSDESNYRVMVFDTTSMSNGMNASYVLGQTDFVSNTFPSAAANTIGTPGYSDIDVDARNYYVWDYGRILSFDINSVSDNESAVGVIGQPDFVTENYLAPTQAYLEGGVGLFFSKKSAKILAADTYYERVLLFDLVRITTTSLPSGQQNVSYSKQLNHEDEQGTVTYSVSSGSLPDGVSLSSSGLLSGTPTVKGSYPVSIRVNDSNGTTGVFSTVSQLELLITGPDTDIDGVEDSVEDAGPNSGDANGDGTKDSEQNNVSSNSNPVSSGYTAVETASGNISNYSILDEANLSTQNDSTDFPLGLNSFSVDGLTAGASTTVTIYYDQEYNTDNWTYMKYSLDNETYTNMDSIVSYGTADVGGATVTTATYTLTDGGVYDEDGIANGTIVDPAGPAVLGELAETGLNIMHYEIIGFVLILITLTISKRRIYKIY